MSLDCVTPAGLGWIAAQRAVIQRCEQAWGLTAIQTPHDRESPVDAFFVSHGLLQCVAEVKARDMTLDQLRGFGSYLVTMDKLRRGRALARALCVPYRLIVGLTDAVCWWVVCNESGRWVVKGKAERTVTQATCNGGMALRVNAYVSLDGMRVLQLPPPTSDVHVSEIQW